MEQEQKSAQRLRDWVIDPRRKIEAALEGLSLVSSLKVFVLSVAAIAIAQAVTLFLPLTSGTWIGGVGLQALSSILLSTLLWLVFLAFAFSVFAAVNHALLRNKASNVSFSRTFSVVFFIASPLAALSAFLNWIPSGFVNVYSTPVVSLGIAIANFALLAYGLVLYYFAAAKLHSASLVRFVTAVLLGSVAVAVVTFTLLLPFTLCCGPPSGTLGPGPIITSELKSIVSSGYGISQPKKVDFEKGLLIDKKTVISDSPVLPEEVRFYCSDGELCGIGSALQIDPAGASVEASQKVQAYVVVCGDDFRKQNPKYCISIARQGAPARQTCEDNCLK